MMNRAMMGNQMMGNQMAMPMTPAQPMMPVSPMKAGGKTKKMAKGGVTSEQMKLMGRGLARVKNQGSK